MPLRMGAILTWGGESKVQDVLFYGDRSREKVSGKEEGIRGEKKEHESGGGSVLKGGARRKRRDGGGLAMEKRESRTKRGAQLKKKSPRPGENAPEQASPGPISKREKKKRRGVWGKKRIESKGGSGGGRSAVGDQVPESQDIWMGGEGKSDKGGNCRQFQGGGTMEDYLNKTKGRSKMLIQGAERREAGITGGALGSSEGGSEEKAVYP